MADVKISISTLKYVLFIFALYLYLYNPPFAFLPLLPIEILIIIATIYLTIQRKWLQILRCFKAELLIFLLIISYCFVREFGRENVFFKVNIFFLLQTIVLPCFLVYYYANIKKHDNLLKDIILVGGVAAFFTMIMIFVPQLTEIIRYQILVADDFTDLITFRSFGISEGLTFAYGTAQGLIFAFVLFYAKDNPKYYYILPIILLSIIFNARIGMVPVIFSLIYFVVIKFNFKFILIISAFSLSFYLLIFNTTLFAGYAETIEWAFDFFTQSSDFVTGNTSGSDNTFDALFGKMAVLPTGVDGWLTGTGENIFLASTDNSDVGYLIQLNYGGIIYLILLLSLVGYMMNRLKFLYKENRWLIFLFIVTILLSNVKGLFISIIPSFRLIALTYVYLIFEYRKSLQMGVENFDLQLLSNTNYKNK